MGTNPGSPDRRRGIRRTTLLMVAIAFAFYAGFILLGVLRSA